MRSVLGIVILVVAALGVFEVGRLLVKGLRGLYRYTFGLSAATAATVAKPAATPKPRFVGRYDQYSRPELTPWEDLPKYTGATGWFGCAKYRDVVIPDKHYYPSVAYMDTPFKQYVHDVMAGWKDTDNGFAKIGRIKAWGSLLALPLVFSLMRSDLMILIWSGAMVLLLLAVVLAGSAGMRASRQSAEISKNLTRADWQEVYLEVIDSQSRVAEMRRAGIGRRYIRGKHP